MKHEIKQDYKSAILAAHSEAEKIVTDTKEAIEKACQAKLRVALLVESVQREYKHSVAHELAEVLSGHEVRQYLTLARTSKAGTIVDKRQLHLVGLMDIQEPHEGEGEHNPKPTKTVSSIMTRAGADVTKKLKNRPLHQWSEEEKTQYTRAMKPFIEIYNQLK